MYVYVYIHIYRILCDEYPQTVNRIMPTSADNFGDRGPLRICFGASASQ